MALRYYTVAPAAILGALALGACEAPEAEAEPEVAMDLPPAVLEQGGPDERALIPDVIPSDGYVDALAAGPDGEVFYLAEAPGESGVSRIVESRWDPDAERFPEPAPVHFSTGLEEDRSPALAPDGSYLLFASSRPADAGNFADFNIWVAQWDESASGGEGDWSAPWPLPVVNSPAWDGAPALAANGNLYLSSRRAGLETGLQLFVSELDEGMWGTAEPLDAPLNTAADETDPWIARDESFLLFASNRDGSFNIYVAFRDELGGWLDPVPLGDAVNTEAHETAPAVSHAGGYIFFHRAGEGMQWVATGDAGIEEHIPGDDVTPN